MLLASGCGGHYGGPTTYTVGRTITGLVGSGLVLQDNGGDNLAVNINRTFTFVHAIASVSTYSVKVFTQPGNPSQSCAVASGSGTAGVNVTNVAVSCTTNSYFIGGTVVSLIGSGGLVLQNNSGDSLTVNGNGTFNFPTAVNSGTGYSVTVSMQPSSGQTCTVSDGSGKVTTGNVTGVSVVCGQPPATASPDTRADYLVLQMTPRMAFLQWPVDQSLSTGHRVPTRFEFQLIALPQVPKAPGSECTSMAKSHWRLLLSMLVFVASPAFACEPVVPFMQTVVPAIALSGSILVLAFAVVLKSVLFAVFEPRLSRLHAAWRMFQGNVLTSLVGLLVAMTIASSPVILLLGAPLVYFLCWLPARRLVKSAPLAWLARMSHLALAGILTGALVASCILFSVGRGTIETHELVLYWVIKLTAIFLALLASITLTTIWEEWVIWRLSSAPEGIGFFSSALRANLYVLLFVMLIPAVLIIPKRLQSPDFLARRHNAVGIGTSSSHGQTHHVVSSLR